MAYVFRLILYLSFEHALTVDDACISEPMDNHPQVGKMPYANQPPGQVQGLFDAKARYKPYKFPCGDGNIQYRDITKAYEAKKDYYGSDNWRCKPSGRVCCNQVVGFAKWAGPGPRGKSVVGVCNGQGATKYRGARVSVACSDPCPPGKCKPEPEDCPCCPKSWHKITGVKPRGQCACRRCYCDCSSKKHRGSSKHRHG